MSFAPNPEIVILGTVAVVNDWEFDSKPKGRIVGVFTRSGFIEVRVPTALDALPFADGDNVALVCDHNNWSMVDDKTGLTKTGVSISLRRLLTNDDLAGVKLAALAASK